MDRDDNVKRPYRSPLRSAQARATRMAVVAAAARLFAAQGYVATSIEEIAAAAGVSRATVFNSGRGGKPALLHEAYLRAVRGDDEPLPLGRRPEARRILADRDPQRLLAAYAGVVATIAPRLAGVHEAARNAAQADPEAGTLWETIRAERRYGAGRVVAALNELGALRPDLDPEHATDLLWLLNDPSHHALLVGRQGWAPDRFEAWLAETMQVQLLARG